MRLNRIDPSGLCPPSDEICDALMQSGDVGVWSALGCSNQRSCGLDVTDWFTQELKNHADYTRSEFNDASDRLRNRATPNSDYITILSALFYMPDRVISDDLPFRNYARAIPHKWMQFDVFDGSSESHCPCTDCTRTVTLCDKCIDRSELGNIIFGMAGALAEYTNGQLYAAARSANGFGGVAEQATGGLGYALVTTGTLGSQLTSQELCSFFERADGNWDNVPGFAAPVGRWQWENVNQGDASENCVPCKDKLPSWYPHTIPTSSGGVAGNSRFANRPDHEDPFYVYQIPSSQFLTPELCADATVYEDTQRVNCGTGRLGD